MDVSEYRKQYQEQLQRAAEQKTSYRDLLNRSKAAPEGALAAESFGESLDQDEVAALIAVARNSDENLQLRIEALDAISNEIDEHAELIDVLLELLQNQSEPTTLRRSALLILQQISFRATAFAPKRPEFLAALRATVEDPDTNVRQLAIGILAREKDEYVQRRLIEGLEHPSRALIRPAKAIQLLSYDVHAEYYPLLQKIVQRPPNRAAKKEAIRLLASDPSSKDLLAGILADKTEHRDVRSVSAVALQSLAPTEFEEQAKQIVLDDDDDDQLRATCMNALTLFANPTVLSEDSTFNKGVDRMEETSTSKQLKQATASYITKRNE
jgi:hypothetical protein